MQQFYTLEEAAKILRTTPDKLRDMARKNEVRAFQDRGTLRFRSQEIDERARSLGLDSDPDLPLGETPPAKSGNSSSTRRRSPSPKPKEGGETFGLSDDAVSLGDAPQPSSGPASSRGSPSSSARKKSPPPAKSPHPGSKKPSQLKSPPPAPPKPASDSDVRLVLDGSDLDFQIDVDEPQAPPPPSGPKSSGARKSRVAPADSGPRVLPLDDVDSDLKMPAPEGESDSEVPLHPAERAQSDSDIRLEGTGKDPGKGSHDALVTEEIDLDAEAARLEKTKQPGKPKPRAKSGIDVNKPSKAEKTQPGTNLPSTSPFELSEGDKAKSKGGAAKPAKPDETGVDSSEDFELTPAGDSPLDPGSGEKAALDGSGSPSESHDEDAVSLGELGESREASGINLRDPADSGISLESGNSDEIEFELTLDEPAANTPKPTPASIEEDEAAESSSEFELSLSDDDSSPTDEPSESDSEFELSLDIEDSGISPKSKNDEESSSDSEFELTLDEGDAAASSDALEVEDEKDIFETDFEVPALDEDSASEAVSLEEESDTDLEGSSDFELSLEEDASIEEDVGSEIVELDEDDADAAASTVARPLKGRRPAADEEEELEVAEEDESMDLDLDAEEEEIEAEVEEEEEPVAAGVAPPQPWGPMPGVLLIFSSVFLFITVLMGYELVTMMTGYQRATPVGSLVVAPLARMIDDSVPGKD